MRITLMVAQAKEAVQTIKSGDLAEIKSYKVPDPMILHVMQVVWKVSSRDIRYNF